MNRLALMAVAVAASSAAVPAAGTEGNAWPFAILRIYGNGESNDGFLRQVAAAQERHPGLIDEVWLWGGGVFLGTNLYHEAVADNLRWAGELRKRGIGVGFQVGPTLNYSGALDAPRPGFSDEAWVMTDDGVRHPSIFCATSPEAVEENRRVAEVVMAGLKPDSVWPDDDLRNSKRGNRVCFCPRCIALFNAEFGGKWTREALSAALYGSRPSKEARERWAEFNRRVLGRFARLYREAADKVHPACRLGLQQVGACDTYNGRDYRPILESLSGAGRHSVGMRPGAGYYCDRSPRDMFGKIQWVMLEATRCRGYGFVGQVCYESENWPHVSAEKNPGSQMVENSLALAVGCDSLALYWGTDLNRESDANYAFYLDTFAKWKPFLLAIRDAFKGTRPSGISEFRGADEALNHWCGRWGPVPPRLVENALPLSCEGGDVFAYWLDAERTKDVTSADLPRLLARPVLADVAAFEALARKFPDAAIMRKVRVDSFKELNVASSERQASEVFPGGCKASDFNHVITPLADDVRPFSEVSGRPGACGTCVIPSGYGGALVVCQNLTSEWLWTGPRRKAILDALESVAPGGMSVRLLTGGYSVAVVGRTDSDGRTAGAYVLNPTPGETPPLELALRRPRKGRWFVRTVEGERPAQILRMSPDEVVVRLPPLAAWQPLLLAASSEVAAPKATEENPPRIAVFGGSFSRIGQSAAAKDAWAKALHCKIDTYGVNGCGFEAGRDRANDVSGQVARALAKGVKYKAFVLWASGNDFRYPPSATSNGVERAVKLIREGAPQAKIVLLNSIDEPFKDDVFRAKLRTCAEAQNGICAKLGVPVLDLNGGSGITRENGRELVGKDNCHMTWAGYRFIAPMTTEFLVRNLKKDGAWDADNDG